MLDLNWIIAMRRAYKDAVMITHDAVALVFSVYLSNLLTYGHYEKALSKDIFAMLITFGMAMAVFVGFGLYRSSVRYMGYQAMLSILQATIMYAVILFCTG